MPDVMPDKPALTDPARAVLHSWFRILSPHDSMIAACLAAAAAALGITGMGGCGRPDPTTPRWGVYETALTSVRAYSNPFQDVDVRVRFIAPSGRRLTIDAFWDGGRTWRVRFSPDETGRWQWESMASDERNWGLHGQHGLMQCGPAPGADPLDSHGPIRLSPDRRHFMHADGTPWLWIGDTAWNGVLRATLQDWNTYLAARRTQGFTAIQFVDTHWRAAGQDPAGETAWTGTEGIRLNPAFFQRLDPKVAAINAHGLVGVPVVLWTALAADPGQALPESDALRVARHIVARWGAYSVIWFLGGDGHYERQGTDRWNRIGRAVFGGRADRLVTMHPSKGSNLATPRRQGPPSASCCVPQ